MVLNTGFSPSAGQLMTLIVPPCSCSMSTPQHISVLDEASSCSSFYWLLHAFTILDVNHYGLESTMTVVGLSPGSLNSAPHGVMSSVPRSDLAC